MHIRNATMDDLPAIVAIYNASIPGRLATADLEPVNLDDRVAWFNAHTLQHPIWVADYGDVAGWVSLQPFYGRPAYHATAEVSVYVAPSRRRQDIGRTLLAEALRRSPELGLSTLLGFIFGHNEPSLRLFEGLGFQRWGVLPRIADMEGIERDLVIVGKRVGPEAAVL